MSGRPTHALLAALLATGVAALSIRPAAAATPSDPVRNGAGFRQQLGQSLPLDVVLRDEGGAPVPLSSLAGRVPLVLVMGYFHCPNLCGLIRADLLTALRGAQLRPGVDYELLAVSIDPLESAGEAARAKAADLGHFGAPGGAHGWHFLTGSSGALARLERAAGFSARALRNGEYAHPAGVVFTSPHGIISSYLLGVGYTSRAVRQALGSARAGAISVPAWPVRLVCYRDPLTGRYSLAILKLLRATALFTLGTLAVLWWCTGRRSGAAP